MPTCGIWTSARSAGIVRGLIAGRKIVGHLAQDPLQVADQFADGRDGRRVDLTVAAQILRPKLAHRRSREDYRGPKGPDGIDWLPHFGDVLGAHESTQYVPQFDDTIGKRPSADRRHGAGVAREHAAIVDVV